MTAGQLVSSSRTPRQQRLLAHTSGRARLDVCRIVTNPYPHGVKTYDKVSTQSVCNLKPTGKAKVDTTNNHAASVAQGSAGVPPPRSYRHQQRRHFDTTSICLADMPETVVPKRGKFHRPAGKPVEKALTNMALIDGEEKRYLRKAQDEELQNEFRVFTSPMRRNHTFTPVEKVDRRSRESRLMPNGASRKERGRTFAKIPSANAAVVPPWATDC